MRNVINRAAVGVLVCLLGSIVGGTARSGVLPSLAQPPLEVPSTVWTALEEAQVAESEFLELDLVVPPGQDIHSTKAMLESAGGELVVEEKSYLQVKLPLAEVSRFVEAVPAAAIGVNQPVKAGLMELVPSSGAITAADVGARALANLEPSGIPQFRRELGVSGAGIKIAIIDSGIDPGHPDLMRTPDGKPKVVDWKDFTSEGVVRLTQSVPWGSSFVAPGGLTYRLPPRPQGSLAGRFGYWDESKVPGLINRDLDRNGSPVDRFGVLAVDSSEPGRYDLVYVDTNNDGDFNDEVPLGVFRETQSVAWLGRVRIGPVAERRLAFVISDLSADGSRVTFGFDSLGHGTQVAGVAAASGSSGFTGVAPGAQVMALKVITSRNDGDWFSIRQAIQYAVEQGAEVINVSLGGLQQASAFDTTASLWLNEIATRNDVLILLAADNTGPGLSSGTTLGSPSDIPAVGAYYSPEMWRRDYGVVVPHEGIWWRSGMGPRMDGSYLPNLVAPGGSPTTSPRWLDPTGYTTAAGTSIAVPHVSGSAALLLEAARRNGLATDHRSIRRSLEEGAREILGVDQFEQGNGVLNLPRAYKELLTIQERPALMGRGAAGGDGLYVRAHRPGNGSFVLTNLTGTLTRVNVYSSEGWVQPAFRSVTVPPGQERELPLNLDPPQTPGVHASFIQLIHPDQVVPSVVLPVTYVRPVQLDASQRFSASDRLNVTRYQRYFIPVESDATSLVVSGLVLTGPSSALQGTVQVQVFRPDGQKVFSSDAVGAQGSTVSTTFNTSYPIPGLWEVVVTALPDTDGSNLTANYRLDVQVPSSKLSLPLRYTVAPGSRVNVEVPVMNPGPPVNARVEVFGLSRKSDSQPWTMKVQLNQIDEFTLSTMAGSLVLETQNAQPASMDLDLWLYRYDHSRGWELYWSARTNGVGRERMQLRDVPPGRYQVFAALNGAMPSSLQYQYRRTVMTQNQQLGTANESRRRELGQVWNAPVTIYAPLSPGKYVGQVVLTNADTGDLITWYPIEVSVGQPTLQVEPRVSQLRTGVLSSVVLEVRDSQTNRLVDAPVMVNGTRYLTRRGTVTVPVRTTESLYSMRVEIDVPAYQFLTQAIQIPVRQAWGSHPIGAVSTPENSQLRRKVQSLLP